MTDVKCYGDLGFIKVSISVCVTFKVVECLGWTDINIARISLVTMEFYFYQNFAVREMKFTSQRHPLIMLV